MDPFTTHAFFDELMSIHAGGLHKLGMGLSTLAAGEKMFGGLGGAAKKMMRSPLEYVGKVPRPGQLSGALAPPTRVPRPTARIPARSPSAMAPPPPRLGGGNLFTSPAGPSPFAP